jgi:hypothetical protein
MLIDKAFNNHFKSAYLLSHGKKLVPSCSLLLAGCSFASCCCSLAAACFLQVRFRGVGLHRAASVYE